VLCLFSQGLAGPITPGAPGVLTVTPERMRTALEPLLLKYGVDAVFVGHNHNAERTHAIANLRVVSRGRTLHDKGPHEPPATLYESPGAPIHWVVGSGGADPSTIQWKHASEVPWLATQLYDDAREATNWGWAKVEANRTAFEVVFMDSYRKQQLDRVIITK